jgi:hypothetical protein
VSDFQKVSEPSSGGGGYQEKNMSKGKGRDYSGLIIWASVLIGSVRYAAAYLSSDLGQIVGDLSTIVTWMIGVSGFATGILGTLGTAYIFDGWRQKMPAAGVKWSSKFKALTLFVFSAFLCEILILVPFTMSRIRHVAITHVLGAGDWWWSTAVVVMPLLLIGGVSVGNKIVTVNTPNAANAEANVREPVRGAVEGVKYSSLDNAQKYYILNTKSEIAARELGVTVRAVQKWRLKAQDELKQGRL